MTVMALSPSTIVVYSPIAATKECLEKIKAVTPSGKLPTHIIMQNDAVDHTLFLKGWRDAVPSAQILAVKPSTVHGDQPLLTAASSSSSPAEIILPPALEKGGMLDAAFLDISPFFQEVVLFHRPSRSLLCADSIWRVVSPRFFPNVIASTGWKIFDVSQKAQFPYWFYFPRRKQVEVKAFLEKIESWGEIDRVLPGHLDPVPTEGETKTSIDVKKTFLKSFDFIVR